MDDYYEIPENLHKDPARLMLYILMLGNGSLTVDEMTTLYEYIQVSVESGKPPLKAV